MLEADVKAADAILWVGISFQQSASTAYFRRVRRYLQARAGCALVPAHWSLWAFAHLAQLAGCALVPAGCPAPGSIASRHACMSAMVAPLTGGSCALCA